MDHHISTYCTNATALGGAPPPECLPKPAAKPGAPPAPAFVPADAARMAVDKLTIPTATINTPLCAGCNTLVGLPVWLWTQPWQTQTATATAGPYTVTAVARPTQIVYDLGDGRTPPVVCYDAGVPWQESYGLSDPYCGGRYERRGDWTITATWTWQVTWSGAATGSQTINTTSTAPIAVRESQAIIKSNF